MSRRIFISILVAICLAGLWAVFAQQRELENLRAEQQRLQTEIQSPAAAPVQTASPESRPAVSAPSSELLRLRSQVSQLTQRKRELASLPVENERLRAQVATRSTNIAAGIVLPPGYIRKSQAQFVGYNTPEDTLQSFLWALQNRDTNSLLQALGPYSWTNTLRQMNNDLERFWKDADAIPGMVVLEHGEIGEHGSDKWTDLRVEMVPGARAEERISFQLVNGQWKMDFP
jgi:cell division protein FtsB